MPETLDLLVEIGTEELPPKELSRLSLAFEREFVAALARAQLEHGSVFHYATPRRLALHIEALLTSQPERQVERRGPALKIAFGEDGTPSKAALGFARSCGVDVEHLERQETNEGGWLIFRTTEVAQFTVSLLTPMLEEALGKLPIARRMRWGEGDAQFVRPVRWALILFGDTPVESEVLDVPTSGSTHGHRFHHPEPIALSEPSEYASKLYSTGRVVADFETRRDMIREQLVESGHELGGETLIDEKLLEEVTAMVEWPVPITGSFEAEFLELPHEALIATMQGHQRYFPVHSAHGGLLPAFVTIANIESSRPDSIREGNERVIRPRLKDAAFFVANDRKIPLEQRLESLEHTVFQHRLGSLADKSRRVSQLARHLAIAMGANPDTVAHAGRAGLLCKCDLVTEMVGEFPELQGHMGKHYAESDGEPREVARAIEETYLPRFSGDRVPTSPAGQAVAVADKLDTLTGIFAAGLPPTGDKDPFALRRAALGILRILIEANLDVDLPRLVEAAIESLPEAMPREGLLEAVSSFMNERLRAYFSEQGIAPDVFASVLALGPSRPFDFAQRVHAVQEFRLRPESTSLAAANKRIRNILRQADCDVPVEVDEGLLTEDAEWNLAAKLVGITPRVNEMLSKRDYANAMSHLAGLKESIDDFFDSVKVMDDDESTKANRLALLNNVGTLFLQTADISELQS